MTPDEIARDVVGRWVLHSKSADELCDAIASAIRAERDAVLRALGPGSRFMDPPDGGDPTPAEQVANMRAQLNTAEAERDRLRDALQYLHDKFATDLRQGYSTRDKVFVVEITSEALARKTDVCTSGGSPVNNEGA